MIQVVKNIIQESSWSTSKYIDIVSDESFDNVLNYCRNEFKAYDKYINGVKHKRLFGLEKSEWEIAKNDPELSNNFNKQMTLDGEGWYHLEDKGNGNFEFTTYSVNIC